MAFHHRPAIFVYWFLVLCFVVVPLPSCSLQQTKARRTTKKAHDRFESWTSNCLDEKENSRLLWVDGNNVRGIGKFEWNAVELQHRVVRLCHKYKIPNAIVVWDHGSHTFSSLTRYSFDDSGTEIPVDVAKTDDDDNNMFCVNLVILFSGIRQRADDVIVKESNHLVSPSFQDGNKSDMKMNWASLAFVTNDRDLNYKLRQQSMPNPPSIRLSRRKRRDNGKLYDHDIDSTSSTPSEEKNRKAVANPLFCDSTGFMDLLSELPGEYDMKMNGIDMEASKSIENAKASIRRCSTSQRRGYNPRREKTWERCVQAETFRRFLDESSYTEKEELSEVESPLKLGDRNAVFIANCVQELQSARGYSSTVQGEGNGDKESNNDTLNDQFSPFLGPARLDKKERRLLDRYNALVRNGESA